ncbi:MAG: invasion associated locus B family protein [Pararhodobacter sp.]|nr:invasion associated locus B family protein [Pararhodobacter sp.]
MTLRIALRTTFLSALLCLPQLALAQDETTEAEAEQSFSPGEPYLVATHRDWELLCTRFEEDGDEVCEMYQLLIDEDESPIAEISIAAIPPGTDVVAGATITTPLETFLPTGLGWSVGDAEEMRVEGFRMCAVIGCIARIGFSAAEIEEMKRGTHANITIAPFVAIDQPVDIRVSLMGFTAALDDLQARIPATEPAE